MKKTKQCPKCQSRRIAYLPTQPDDAGDETPPRPRMAHAGVGASIGILEAYVCADCGCYESYVKAPDRVMWDEMKGLRWLNPPASRGGPGPYR